MSIAARVVGLRVEVSGTFFAFIQLKNHLDGALLVGNSCNREIAEYLCVYGTISWGPNLQQRCLKAKTREMSVMLLHIHAERRRDLKKESPVMHERTAYVKFQYTFKRL